MTKDATNLASDAFFRLEGGGYLPMPACRGPWDPKSLHGRVIVGLLAHEIERRHGDPERMPARLTVDMYRLPGFAPLTVTTSLLRDGHRIRVIDAELFCDGVSMARASCQMLRRTANPPTRVWRPPDWEVPMPEEIELPEGGGRAMGGMWAVRPIEGAVGSYGPKRIWMSELRELVEGVALTPWMRAALAADFASPFANSGEGRLGFINTDVTLYMQRLPRDAWIGLEVTNHQSSDGVAIGECFLHDRHGAIGTSTVAALAQQRRR